MPDAPDQPTKLQSDADRIHAYRSEIKSGLLRPAAGMLTRPYLSAGTGQTYPDLTDWDAIWAGAAYLIDGDAEPLRNSLLNLLEHIGPDGKGQRRIGKDRYSAPPYQIRPFLAAGCFVLSRETDDVTWLGPEGFEQLEAYLLYRHSHNMGREGLLTWLHIDEGFGDNATANWAWEPNVVEAVDLNAQMVYEHTAFAWLATRVGDERRASRHTAYARRLAASINRLLWNEEDAFYYSLYIPPLRQSPSQHISAAHASNLWPLWLGIVPDTRARRIIDRYVLSAEHMWSDYGIRSLSRSSRHYNNAHNGIAMPIGHHAMQGPAIDTATCSNWQGPVWALHNYFAVQYLRRYGYFDEAREVAARIMTLHAASLEEHGAYFENFDAETGSGLAALGIGSWGLMLPQLVSDLETGSDWWLRGLELPQAEDDAGGHPS
ncbi:MGH1-like glycoside hydrolase domain-containing protein [Ruania alba]|uniref:Trehalase n=1 Tax=Ruania alba TaxID=648782 RepID=A0A1H5M8H6_9MICO|nr:trehalase family glycosidase [Ruania alba]SEE85582.1 Trehalase [Ruania alba]